mgnify:CR=1 FL=1
MSPPHPKRPCSGSSYYLLSRLIPSPAGTLSPGSGATPPTRGGGAAGSEGQPRKLAFQSPMSPQHCDVSTGSLSSDAAVAAAHAALAQATPLHSQDVSPSLGYPSEAVSPPTPPAPPLQPANLMSERSDSVGRGNLFFALSPGSTAASLDAYVEFEALLRGNLDASWAEELDLMYHLHRTHVVTEASLLGGTEPPAPAGGCAGCAGGRCCAAAVPAWCCAAVVCRLSTA